MHQRRGGEIVAHRQPNQNWMTLKHQGDALPAHGVRRLSQQLRTVTTHVAAQRRQNAGHGENERGFTGAVGTEQRRDLAGRDVNRNIAQHRPATARHEEIADGQRGLGHGLFASQISAAHDRIVEYRTGRSHGQALAEVEHQGLHADRGDKIGVVIDEHELGIEG